MAIKDRPYVGSWEIGKQTIVRHTPDARVLINGQAEFAICATCNKKTDFNRYITSVSVDPSTDGVSGASISLSVPRHATDVFSHDGNYVLEPGLEIVIQMRGYFPVKGYAAKGQEANVDSEGNAGPASEETPVYPYYQVFRGVVTEVSHEFSGGFYTASLSAQNILHFWQYLYLSTNGSVFGERPPGADLQVDLTGHRFTGMSPYGIIYALMRVGFGAAFGVNWTISQTSNISAVDEGSGEALFKHASLWWQKRWEDSSMRLRMYGFDGSLFNAMEQAYLGIFNSKDENNASLVNQYNVKADEIDFEKATTESLLRAAAEVGYRGTEITSAVLGSDGFRMDAAKMQAYTLDLGRLGSVNFFESEYMSKMEIANAVKDIAGFEFFQDVDGDIVFKPPFYNLDTSDDPVYRISDRELISISESHSEPEATYVKGSGSTFANFTGILSGEFGTRGANFVDWRLVSQYGWKETSFESNYYSSSKHMFVGALMRLDTANMESKSASITIPLRPELRPGYPVYIEHLDCYYYVKSMSHSFAAGGACQTTLTCAAKRAKWLPPGMPDRAEGGSVLPRLDQVRLSQPGDYPPMPLYVFPENVEGSTDGASGPPRIIGYPNVVLALDPTKINPRTIPGLPTLTDKTLFDAALSIGALRRNPEDPDNSYLLATSDDPSQSKVIQKSELWTVYVNVAEALQATNTTDVAVALESEGANPAIGQVITAVYQSFNSAIEDAENLNRYMALQRSLKNVFGATGRGEGEYRYYSSSAPDVVDQSPSEVLFDQETGAVTETVPGPADSQIASDSIAVLRQKGDRITVESGAPSQAFRVYGLNPEESGDAYVDLTTKDIRFLNFSRHVTRVRVEVSETGNTDYARIPLDIPKMKKVLIAELQAYAVAKYRDTGGPDLNVDELFGASDDIPGSYKHFYDAIRTYSGVLSTKAVPKLSSLSTFSNAFSAFTKVSITPAVPATTRVESSTLDDGVTVLEETFDVPEVPAKRKTVSKPKKGTLGVVTGTKTAQGIVNLAQKVGDSLGTLLGNAQSKKKREKDADANYLTRVLAARTELLQSFPSYKEADDGSYTFTTTAYNETSKHTAVMPVSDNRGYEVYGSLAYGRGMNIRAYQTLLETQGSPSTAASMKAVETFFAALARTAGQDGAQVPIALGALSPQQKAQLATALETDDSGLEATISAIISSDASESIYVRNTPVTSRSRGMSNTDGVSIAGLADLSADGNTVCLCKGVEATHFLQAFTGEFVELTGDEAVNDFLTTEAAAASDLYSVTKQALAGEVLDTRFRNELERVKKNFVNSITGLAETTRSEGQAITDEFNSVIEGD